jgi:WD40 repeat protein
MDLYLHDAFISYSRKDKPFAVLLERTLRRYTPPSGLPVPKRRLDIFRDEEDFTGTEYYQAVGRHLQGSRKLIVICSPNARASSFVNDEIQRFAQVHAAEDLIPILIAGDPETTNSANDADMAFPAALCERLELPLASDYRGFDPKSSNLHSPRYRTSWYKLLADICNCSRAEIERREKRRKFRRRIQWGGAVAVISTSLAVVGFVAERESRSARSNDLANQALGIAESDPERSTSLALEAIGESRSPLSLSSLRVALSNLPNLLVSVSPDTGVYDPVGVAFAPDERRVVIVDKQSGARVLDVESGQKLLEVANDGKPLVSAAFSLDGAMLDVLDANENTVVYESASGRRITAIRGELRWLSPVTSSGPTALTLRANTMQFLELTSPGPALFVKEIAPRGYSRDNSEVSPDGHRLAIVADAGGKTRLTITDLTSGRTVSQTGDFSSNGVVWSPRGAYLVSKWLMGFALFDTKSLENPFIKDSGNEISVEDAAFSADEKLLATTDRNGLTTLWDVKQRKMIGGLQGPDARAYVPTFSPVGGLVSVIYSNGQAALFSIDNIIAEGLLADPVATIDGIWGEVVAARFSPNGKQLFIRYAGGKLAIWNTERWLPERRLPLHYDPQYDAGRPEGLKDVTVAADGSVIGIRTAGQWSGWNVASGTAVAEEGNNGLPITLIAPSKMGDQSLRIAGQQADLLDAQGGRTLRLAHNDEVTAAAFSPNGNCVVTTSGVTMASGGPPPGGNMVRLWDSQTGARLREWHFGKPPETAFFAGSNHIVVLYGGEALIYRTSLCEAGDVLIQLAGAQALRNAGGLK